MGKFLLKVLLSFQDFSEELTIEGLDWDNMSKYLSTDLLVFGPADATKKFTVPKPIFAAPLAIRLEKANSEVNVRILYTLEQLKHLPKGENALDTPEIAVELVRLADFGVPPRSYQAITRPYARTYPAAGVRDEKRNNVDNNKPNEEQKKYEPAVSKLVPAPPPPAVAVAADSKDKEKLKRLQEYAESVRGHFAAASDMLKELCVAGGMMNYEAEECFVVSKFLEQLLNEDESTRAAARRELTQRTRKMQESVKSVASHIKDKVRYVEEQKHEIAIKCSACGGGFAGPEDAHKLECGHTVDMKCLKEFVADLLFGRIMVRQCVEYPKENLQCTECFLKAHPEMLCCRCRLTIVLRPTCSNSRRCGLRYCDECLRMYVLTVRN